MRGHPKPYSDFPKLDKIGQVHDKHIHDVKRTGVNSKQYLFYLKQ